MKQTHLIRDIFRKPVPPVASPIPFLVDLELRCSQTTCGGSICRADIRIRHTGQGPFRRIGYALEKAGCNDEEILSHCRSPLDHVRGCWVVDLLLGKEDHSMSESRWFESTELGEMFRFLWNHRELSRRKQLLFGIACFPKDAACRNSRRAGWPLR